MLNAKGPLSGALSKTSFRVSRHHRLESVFVDLSWWSHPCSGGNERCFAEDRDLCGSSVLWESIRDVAGRKG